MYIRYFGLHENPFSIPPDPHYLYLSRSHQEAFAHLQYGLSENGGFVQLTGEVGTGKTLLIRTLMERVPKELDVALVLYPVLSVHEFVASICDELRIRHSGEQSSLKQLIDLLNAHLLQTHARGRRTVLIIDEAQNLNREVLEQIRLLTNLETTKQKLLQIILIGQPELSSLLAQRDLRQLSQRITARCHLEALTRKETFEYIFHRCRVAGAKSLLFNRTSMERVYALSGGIPRLINIICDRALLGCYVRNKTVVDPSVVRRAAAEVGIGKLTGTRLLFRALVPASVAALLLIVAGWQMPTLFNSISPGDKVAIALASPQSTAKESSLPVPQNTTTADLKSNSGSIPITSLSDQKSAVPNQTPKVSLEMKIADPAVATDTESAMQRLFDLWGLDYTALAGTTGCERALHAGLHCLYQTGTWNNLRIYNRPAVIELRDVAGQKHHVLVASMTGDSVLLEMGDHRQEVAINEVGRLWFGKYFILWKPRAPEHETLRIGDQRETVVWLRDALARYRREPIQAQPSDLFDEELEYQLKEFQSYYRLAEDGIAGRVTIAQLHGYLPEKSPMLDTESVLVKAR